MRNAAFVNKQKFHAIALETYVSARMGDCTVNVSSHGFTEPDQDSYIVRKGRRRRLLAHRNPFSFRKPNNDISHSQRFPGTLVAEGHTRRGLDFFLAGGDPGRFVIETAQRGAKESFQQVPN